jgi:DNA-3-methyladenine glycosylase II
MNELSNIRIAQPALFSFPECLWYLDRGFDDCLHEVRDGKLRKLLRINGEKVLLELSETNRWIDIQVLVGKLSDWQFVEEYVKDWFDLARDLQPFDALLREDIDFKTLANTYSGLRLVGIPDLFEALCWAVIGQQINLTFAYKLKRRLVENHGDSLVYAGKSYYLFPEPAVVSRILIEDLKAFQFSTKKAEYLTGIAALFEQGNISKAQLAVLPTHVQQVQALTAIRGVGEWSAEYVLMKSLKAMQSIPFGDAGLNNALFQLKAIPKKNNRAEVETVFKPFAGWEAYLAFYLWRVLSEKQ